ncbi:MAG TPA: serine hydrolase domain-containing protein [Gemmatimonas sp.]|nr:serine hydrolase domain-containing protein [Gemmatimonas sp.]
MRPQHVGALATLIAAACLLTLGGCRTAAPSWQLGASRAQALDTVLASAIKRGELPGVAVLVTTKDKILYHRAFGMLGAAARRPLGPDAVFDIASMTKPITSLAAMMLVDEGKLGLDEPASRHLPELEGREVLVRVDSGRGTVDTRPASRAVTVRDLLRHTSGIAYSFSNTDLRAVEQWTKIPERDAPLVHDPGARWTYGMGTAQIGWIIERVSGMPLEEFLRRRIFEPLEMRETSFSLPAARAPRLMTRYRHQGGQWTARRRPDSLSSAGRGDGDLISTAGDYAQFLQLVLGNGTWRGARLVSESSMREMTRDQLHGSGLTVVEQPAAIPSLTASFPNGAGRAGFSLGFQVAVNAPDGRPKRHAQLGGALQHALLDRSDDRHWSARADPGASVLRCACHEGAGRRGTHALSIGHRPAVTARAGRPEIGNE